MDSPPNCGPCPTIFADLPKIFAGNFLPAAQCLPAGGLRGQQPPQQDLLPTGRRILTAGGGLGGAGAPPAYTAGISAKIPPKLEMWYSS